MDDFIRDIVLFSGLEDKELERIENVLDLEAFLLTSFSDASKINLIA